MLKWEYNRMKNLWVAMNGDFKVEKIKGRWVAKTPEGTSKWHDEESAKEACEQVFDNMALA